MERYTSDSRLHMGGESLARSTGEPAGRKAVGGGAWLEAAAAAAAANIWVCRRRK